MNTQPAIPTAMRDSLLVELEACGYSQPDRMAVWGCVVSLWGPEIARLRRIESAACEVLASGQARYEIPPLGALPCLLGDPESRWVGDLVPAAKMTALRAAVEGEAIGDGSGEVLPPFDGGAERTAPAVPPSRFRVGLAEHPKDSDPWIEGDIDVAIAHADGLSRVRGHGVWAVWDRRCEVAAIVFEGTVFTP